MPPTYVAAVFFLFTAIAILFVVTVIAGVASVWLGLPAFIISGVSLALMALLIHRLREMD